MPNDVRRIEILAFPAVQLLDVAGPLQVFATANDERLGPGGTLPYRPVTVAAGEMTQSTSGLRFESLPLPPPDEPLDTLIVAGGYGVRTACEDAALVAWIRARAATARRTASVCSGAFLLATAGLLDGRRAVTHWQRCADFRARFPKVRLEPDPIFIKDGAIWTSAGITAGIDLALAMVEEDLGRAAALTVARHLVMFLKRPGGQSQFSEALGLHGGDGRFDRLHGWILANLKGDLSVAALAARAGMSTRSFCRHYASATGTTPARAVERLRVEQARRLLEQGTTIGRTWPRCGFGSEETMRRSFQEQLGTSPQEYRARFGKAA